jgi:hypothetical protein
MDDNPIIRQQFEAWYCKRFNTFDLESSHAYGAWYGWIEAYKLATRNKMI